MDNTHPTDLDLADLMLGDAAPEVQAHVDQCEQCQAALEGLRSFQRTMRDAFAMPGDVPASIRDNLPAQEPVRVVSIWPKRAMLLAASLLVVAGVVVWAVQARRFRTRVGEAKQVGWAIQADDEKEAPETPAAAARPAGEPAAEKDRLVADKKTDKATELGAFTGQDEDINARRGLRRAGVVAEGLRRAKKAAQGRRLAEKAKPAPLTEEAEAGQTLSKTAKVMGLPMQAHGGKGMENEAVRMEGGAAAKPAGPRPALAAAPVRQLRAPVEARKAKTPATLFMAKKRVPSQTKDINRDGRVDVIDAMMRARRTVSAAAAPPRVGAAAATESKTRQARLILDTGGKTLGAYQVVLTAPPQALAIVGIDGGAANQFAAPPARDRRGLKAGQIRLAAFSLDAHGPKGAVCVATLRVALLKPGAMKALKVQPEVVATPRGAKLPAKARIEWVGAEPAAAENLAPWGEE